MISFKTLIASALLAALFDSMALSATATPENTGINDGQVLNIINNNGHLPERMVAFNKLLMVDLGIFHCMSDQADNQIDALHKVMDAADADMGKAQISFQQAIYAMDENFPEIMRKSNGLICASFVQNAHKHGIQVAGPVETIKFMEAQGLFMLPSIADACGEHAYANDLRDVLVYHILSRMIGSHNAIVDYNKDRPSNDKEAEQRIKIRRPQCQEIVTKEIPERMEKFVANLVPDYGEDFGVPLTTDEPVAPD